MIFFALKLRFIALDNFPIAPPPISPRFAVVALFCAAVAAACGVATDEESPDAACQYRCYHNCYYRNAPILPRHSLND